MAGFGAKVKLSVDRSTAAKAEFNEQINSLTKQIKISNKFVVLQKDMDRVRTSAQTMLNKSPIKITNIDCSQAVTKLRKDLQNVINSLSIKNGVSITGLVDPAGAGTIATQLDNIADAAARGQSEVNRFNAQMSVLKETMSSLATAYKSVLPGGKNAITDTAQLDAITQKYTALKQKIEEVKNSTTVASQEKLSLLQQEAIALQNEIAQIGQARVAQEQAAASAEQAEKAKESAAAAAAQEQAEYRAQLEKVNSLILQTKKNLDSWGASKVGKTSDEYANIQEYVSELEALRAKLLLTGKATDDFGDKFGNLKTKIGNSSTIIKEAGENTKTFSDHVGGLASKFTSWLTISQIIMQVYRALKEMVSVVVEIDTAMTELRKVTDETEATYSKFLDNAAARAKKLGATISDVVTASADFARLGYGLEDAEKLADAAIVYKNVGDGIEDISEASESIIATLQAFGDEISPDDVMLIVDKFNEVGNNFAISSEGIGKTLLRSAAAMHAANNTLDETIALATAANTIVQNPETVGTTLKTVSMYLRAAKTEAEEAGESTDGMAESVSELREEILQLTNNKVDIQIDEDTFKSTYQILKELSEVWDDLTDITQANILEMIGGKRNANVVSALLENFTIAEEALNTSATAAGSALAENEKHIDSIEGKASKFNATFQELATTLIDSDFVKQIVDFGTGLLNVLNAVAKLIEFIGGLNTVLMATVGILAAIKLDSLIRLVSVTLPAAFMKLISPITTVITAIGRLPTVIKSFKSGTALAIPGTSRLSTALKALGISASAAQIAIGALTVAITAAIVIYQKHQQKLQEQRDAAIEAANSAADLSNEIVDLTDKYLELSEAVKTDNSVKEDLLSTQDELIKKLDLEQGRIEELTEKYGNLTDAINAASIESLQSTERDIRGGLNTYEEALLDDADEGWFGSDSISISGSKSNGFFSTSDATRKEQIELYKGLKALEDAGYISSGSYSSYTDNGEKYSQGFAFFAGLYDDLSTVDGVLNAYEELGGMLDVISDEIGSDNILYEAVYKKYNMLSDSVNAYNNAIGSLNSNLAQQYMLQGLVGKELPSTKDEFDAYRQSVIDAAVESGEFIGTDQDIANAVDSTLRAQSQFASFYADELVDAGNSTTYYKAQLSSLTDVMSKLQTAYSALESAEKDMATGQGLTAETIAALAAAEENYLDYLYEENGVIKLNTEAWKENANAKMSNNIAEIQKEIAALQEERAALQTDLTEYEANRQLGNDGGIWSSLIAETTTKLEEISAAILENQGLLALYSSIYSDITGELDAYSAALNKFANIANTIDTVSDSFTTLANLQAEVANGFTISLEKALEFASVYPEILNSATATSDGQIALNEGVVNSFISGKKAELDAQVDAEIAKLNADKAVLTAKMQSAQAQLELAKSVGEGEGQISKEVAEHRINTGNALTAALIDMGIEESHAYALAAAAMSEDEEEFARVAKECFENLDENSAKAAYNMAHAIFVNADNSCNSIADIAAQAHETAKAIVAMGNGDIAGSSGSVFGGSDGNLTSGLGLDLYEGTFNGSDYEYGAKTIDLDDYISQVELDISAYENAINQIDGQIAALEALKNTPLKSFTSDTSGSSGSNGGSGSSGKDEVEEYLADIDEYYEALKRLESIQERLSKLQSQIEYADTEDEKIALTKQLINVYDDEADALENLNKLRSETISNGKAELEALGFQVSYDASTNEFMVHNMGHLNELYGATQEETNELRKSTEELIDTMESLNSSNQEGSSSLRTLKADIKSAKQAIVDYLKEIVTAASDVVDEYQNVYDTLHSAADEYAESGFITIDTLQSIIELGAQYMQYLMDENGLLVINEENINKVLAAKTQELALNQAMTYVERLRLALQENSIEDLNNLLYATTEATNATWGLVYANLALLGLDDDQYQAALHNINAIRSLADSAISGIGQVSGQTTEELNSMKDGLDDILQYVMDMLKQRINDQIDALEDMKDAYADIIALRKEALESAKEEADYQDEVAEKVKEIAKLQARINALSLDDSRDAQSQKAQLEEEMAELQKELADTQADYALDAQKDALDDMQDAYERQKDAEIEVLEDSISSYQKLYDMAISYIESNWDNLYNELISWNYQYGSNLNSSVTTAWDNALAAAQRYGSYVSALNNIGADIDAASGSTPNFTLGSTNYDNSVSAEEMIHAIIKQMYSNSQAWATAGNAERKRLSESSLELGAQLAQYGITAVRGSDGVWYVDRVDGEDLFEKYKNYIYHNGGIVGDEGSLKENELIAKLERGEVMISNRSKDSLFSLIEFVDMLSKRLNITSSNMGWQQSAVNIMPDVGNIPIGTTNNRNDMIHFGDVYIYGSDEQTVEKHREVTRQFTNEVLRQLNIKR